MNVIFQLLYRVLLATRNPGLAMSKVKGTQQNLQECVIDTWSKISLIFQGIHNYIVNLWSPDNNLSVKTKGQKNVTQGATYCYLVSLRNSGSFV